MKKVLFIAYLYPPIANSGTQRSTKFANYLPDFGWQPIVLTVEDPPDRHLDQGALSEVRFGTQVERVPLWSATIAQRIARVFRGIASEVRVAEGLEWRIRALWRSPDSHAWWRRTAVKRAVELFRAEPFDCIYASGYPWTSFLVARDVSKVVSRPFVLDYRDLWTDSDVGWQASSSRLAQVISRYQERKVLSSASAVISVTDSLVRSLSMRLPSSASDRLVCITNGYDPGDFCVEPAPPVRGLKIRIVYTGAWKEGYSLMEFYEALAIMQRDFPELLERLDVVCAGFEPGPASQYGLGGVVQELGRISHRSAVALMKSSNVLFLPVPAGSYAKWSLPGKLFEYLGADRPILAAVPDGSEVAKVLTEVGGGKRVEPTDVNGLATALCAIASAPLWAPADPIAIKRFHRRQLTERLAEVLESASENHGSHLSAIG